MKFLSIFVCLIAYGHTFSQNWTGSINSDWNNSLNWSSVPTNGSDIVINPSNYTGNAVSPIIGSNSTFSAGAISITNGAVLTIAANLTTTDNVEVLDANSEIIVNVGTFSVNFGDGGRLIADLGGKITVNGGIVNVGERLISGFDAEIIINSGNVTTNERLLMDLGGKIILHNGNLTVGQVMALADGDVNGSSYFEQNGGTITVTGEVALENEAGNYEPTILINHGTFTLNGDLVWFGASPGLGTPRVITTGGVFNINGAISNLPLSTVNMMFNIKDSSVVNFTGLSIDQVNSTDSIKQYGNSLFKLSNNHNWNNAGVFYAGSGTVLCTGITNLLGSGQYTFSDIIVNPTYTLNQVLPNEIFINGSFTNYGTFNPSNHKVTFNGSVQQTINGTTPFNFSTLKIDNSFGVLLNHPVSVADSLLLSNGNLNTSATNLLTLNASSSATSGSSNSFVNGPMKKIGNTPFIFPIGKDLNWRRLGVSAPGSVSSELTAEYFNSSSINTNTFNSPLSAVSNIEHWQLEKSNPTDNINIELYWENASLSGITDCAATTITHYNGTSWDNVNSLASGVCTSNGFGSVASISPQSNLGIFTFGYFGNVVSQTLTICNGDSIIVGSNSYNASGNYLDVLLDMNNDDSTVITNLNVLPVLASSQNIEICLGESLTVGNSTYTTTGLFTDTLTSIDGCDSTVTTLLTVANAIDISIVMTGVTLSANNGNATTYQWLDCGNGNAPISGETNATFSPLLDGEYAVEITEGNCKDTSACFIVNGVGISEQYPLSNISVYPNPSSGIVKIQLPNDLKSVNLQLADVTGKVLIENLLLNKEVSQLDLTLFPTGIYIVKLSIEDAIKTLRLIKE